MRLSLADPTLFKSIFNTIKEIAGKYSLNFTPNGLSLQCIDHCRVAIFELFMDKGYFEEYYVQYDTIITVDSEVFSKCCHLIQSNDTLILANNGEDTLQFMLNSDIRKLRLTIITMVVDDELLDCDQSIPYTHYFKFDSKLFAQYYSELKSLDCQNIGFINSDNDTLTIGGKNDTTDIAIEVNKSDKIIFFKTRGNLSQEYPIKYINIINKLSLLFKNVNIHMGNDLPIKVTGKINDESWIRMILAPKITD